MATDGNLQSEIFLKDSQGVTLDFVILRLRSLVVSVAAVSVAVGGVATLSNTASATFASPAPTASAADLSGREGDESRSLDRAEDLAAAVEVRTDTLNEQSSAIDDTSVATLAQQRADAQDAIAAAQAAAEEDARFRASEGYNPGTTDPKEIAREMAANKYGWGDDQFTCYNNIIMRESMWDTFADNPTSSAYGIPQALPGNRMASEGADWKTNPATQIKWGLKYVAERYGTPCSAWSFKAAHGWY